MQVDISLLTRVLKALAFQLLEVSERKVLSTFLVSTANLHLYTVAVRPYGDAGYERLWVLRRKKRAVRQCSVEHIGLTPRC